MVTILQQEDDVVRQVAAVLRQFEESHRQAECIVYRYNPASIRVKIVDEVFHDRSKGEKHDYAMSYLKHLPEDVLAEISILLCLAPGELSLLDGEFEDPSRSQL